MTEKPHHFMSRRLVMRDFTANDAACLAEYLADPLVSGSLVNVPDDYQLADAERFIASAKNPDYGMKLAIALQSSPDKLIGGFGLALMPQEAVDFIADKMPIPETPLLAVGYWIARPLWGKGYAGEMLRTMRPLCAKLFHRTMLGAMVYDGNVASLRALARANFTNIGLLESQTGKKAGAKAHVLVWRSPI